MSENFISGELLHEGVYLHTKVRTCMHACMHACIHARTRAHKYTYMKNHIQWACMWYGSLALALCLLMTLPSYLPVHVYLLVCVPVRRFASPSVRLSVPLSVCLFCLSAYPLAHCELVFMSIFVLTFWFSQTFG